MRPANPLGLDNAIPFWAWAVSDDGLRLLLFWPGPQLDAPLGLRFHIADEPDAVHILVTNSAGPPLPAPAVEEHEGWPLAMTEHQRAEVALPSPLGRRPVVDATAGASRPRVSSGEQFSQRFCDDSFGSSAIHVVPPGEHLRRATRRWHYDDAHHVIRFVPPPGHPDESRAVSLAKFNGTSPSDV